MFLKRVRTLVVNADDFGFTRDVNQGIVEAHRDGILTSTTLMAIRRALRRRRAAGEGEPSLDIGCHLVLVGEPPFPATVAKLMQAVALKRIRIYDELAAQVRRILRRGPEAHASGYAQAHALAAARAGRGGANLGGVRHSLGAPPFDFPLQPGGIAGKRAVNRVGSCAATERVLRAHGCRFTDHFAGFQITGKLRRGRAGCADSRAARRLDRVHVPPRALRRGAARRADTRSRRAASGSCAR